MILAAKEQAINSHNVHGIDTRVIFEAANGPTTFHAETVLNHKGVICVPDMLVSTGGVTVSYFEWLKNLLQGVSGRRMTMSRSHLRKMQVSMLQVAGLEHKASELLCTSEREFVHTALEEIMT